MENAFVKNDEKAKGPDQIRFCQFTLDLLRRGLYRGGERVRLTPKPFETLAYLVKHSGRTVEKRELLEAVWEGTHVTEGTLAQAIKEIRRALRDDKDSPRFVLTVHRRGYRFICGISPSMTNPVSRRAQEGELSPTEFLRNRNSIKWKRIALTVLALALILTLALLYRESAMVSLVFIKDSLLKSEEQWRQEATQSKGRSNCWSGEGSNELEIQ